MEAEFQNESGLHLEVYNQLAVPKKGQIFHLSTQIDFGTWETNLAKEINETKNHPSSCQQECRPYDMYQNVS